MAVIYVTAEMLYRSKQLKAELQGKKKRARRRFVLYALGLLAVWLLRSI